MKTEYEYVQMRHIINTKKTETYHCVNIKSQAMLGEIKWYGAWRQYCYFPTVQAVYNIGCLNDISHFIKQLTDKRKDARNSN